MSAAATFGAAAPARPRAAAAPWRGTGLALAALALLLLALFARDAGAMAAIWWTSSTYEHCLVLPPLIAWLVWERRAALAAVRPTAWLWPLPWVALGALAWLAGAVAEVAVARHCGLVMIAQGAIAALIGPAATRILLFPLFYAFFLVPAGDALVPPLQSLTARLCLLLLHATGVPARLDGVFLTTPGGWFKVAEACSGAKFLIAMLALGALVAARGFRGWRRRLLFLAACALVPVLANAVRAFATIWIAQRTGAAVAGGVDHLVYGWIFFALVIALVLAGAWPLFDRPAGGPAVAPEAVARAGRLGGRLSLGQAWAGAALLAAAAPLFAAALTGATRPLPPAARLPDLGPAAPAGPGPAWHAHFAGADRMLTARIGTVDVAVALFRGQGQGHELVGYGQGAIDPEGVWSWTADQPAPAPWRAARITAPGPATRTVWTVYRVGALVGGDPRAAKAATLATRLAGGDPRAAALLLAGPDPAAVAALAARLGPPERLLDPLLGRR
ncbi:exosortase A [Sphingomonas morindae]|uniref:EpsI family protein n=1 Tax=Sphingomonas morindae TaxID=1541170 RepID=A0ABY4X5F3_9SPHN|nr:exosortase A [Sphingomonas morindae]USI72127.1 EpsI family protein [Sphingomonas morindae]